jgi:hypothetical protein
MLAWLLLSALQLYADYSGQLATNPYLLETLNKTINSYFPIILHIVTLAYIPMIYKKFVNIDFIAISLLIIANVFLFLNDVSFYLVSYITFDPYVINEIFAFTWLLAVSTFL